MLGLKVIFLPTQKNRENPFERQNYQTDEYMPNRFDEISKGWDGWVNSLNCRISILALTDLYFLFLKTEIFVFHESLQKARYFAKIPALLAPLSEKLTKPLYKS